MERSVRGKSVLVIGGAGTIGKSLIKALLEFRPDRLVVVDWNENGLAELTRDLRSSAGQFVPPHFLTYPFDFGGPVFHRFLEREGPFDILAHFAAHKHVRTEKDIHAIEAMLRNNLFATVRLLESLQKQPPNHFFAVSTDKASAPASVMGASKKLMEEAILSFGSQLNAATARFANVAFSNGSLPDSFLNRLQRKQPLVAPRDIRRYFVSPEEAGQLCLLATLTGTSGEILFPKMDRTHLHSFARIAQDLLLEMDLEAALCASEEEAREKSAAWKEGEPYPLYLFDTNTSGEKKEEIFYSPGEPVNWDRYAQLGVIRKPATFAREDWPAILTELEAVFEKKRVGKSDLIEVMARYLADFQHTETGKKLDDRM
jgi:nucleoside-diphosphate-sugar epimerase